MSPDIEVVELSSGRALANRVWRARGWRERARGLLGRASLEAQEGLLLRPCRQVHTFFMRFPIDVLFLDRESRVVGICRAMPPQRLSPIFWRAAMALELAAGQAEWVGVGNRLGLHPRGDDA